MKSVYLSRLFFTLALTITIQVFSGACNLVNSGRSDSVFAPSTERLNSANDNRVVPKFDVTEKKVPVTGDMVVFSQDGKIVVVGESVLVWTNSFETDKWESSGTVELRSSFSVDGGKNFTADGFPVESNKTTASKQICPVEDAVFGGDGRLYVLDRCEGSTNLWSIATSTNQTIWSLHGFVPADEDSLAGDQRTRFGPSRLLATAAGRVLAVSELDGALALLAFGDLGHELKLIWRGDGFQKAISIDFLDGKFGTMLLSNGTLLRTSDGGSTWSKFAILPVDLVGKVIDIRFASVSMGYLVGESGIVYRTHDGGKSWDSLKSFTNSTLFDIEAVTDREVWVIGDDCTLIYTNDSGEHWAVVPLPDCDKESVPTYKISVWMNSAYVLQGERLFRITPRKSP